MMQERAHLAHGVGVSRLTGVEETRLGSDGGKLGLAERKLSVPLMANPGYLARSSTHCQISSNFISKSYPSSKIYVDERSSCLAGPEPFPSAIAHSRRVTRWTPRSWRCDRTQYTTLLRTLSFNLSTYPYTKSWLFVCPHESTIPFDGGVRATNQPFSRLASSLCRYRQDDPTFAYSLQFDIIHLYDSTACI